MKAEVSPPVITIDMKPHHLFRYPSEWDPRQNGKTKGGYLEGKIQLPKTSRNLRVLVSTHPEKVHNFRNTQLSQAEKEIHPTLIHVVRKGRGNRRFNEKEPVPNISHWQQEFLVIDGKIFICNKTSDEDEPRYKTDDDRIKPRDEMFSLTGDHVLRIGKEAGELNLIILIPKTDKRASVTDVSLNKLLQGRTENKEVFDLLSESYRGKNSVNLKKVKLKVEVFCLESGVSLGSSLSCAISDTASKAHGAMDLHDATPLRSCASGGRKVVMIAEFGLAKDVEPRFQLYDNDGRRLIEEEDKLLTQPSDVSVMKESIIFITPQQKYSELILRNKFRIKLVARRESDGYVSRKKFDFSFVPHDYYTPHCIFCYHDPDNEGDQRAKLAPMRDVARPGVRKRQMSDLDTATTQSSAAGASYKRRPTLDDGDIRSILPTVPLPKLSPTTVIVSHPPQQQQQLRIVDTSNNTSSSQDTLVIKEEAMEEENSNSSTSALPFHDLSHVRTIPVTRDTVLLPVIKKEQ